ncbi:hypothetical protein GQ457_02G018210 [Hibiscus cannabinus]
MRQLVKERERREERDLRALKERKMLDEQLEKWREMRWRRGLELSQKKSMAVISHLGMRFFCQMQFGGEGEGMGIHPHQRVFFGVGKVVCSSRHCNWISFRSRPPRPSPLSATCWRRHLEAPPPFSWAEALSHLSGPFSVV